KRAKKIDSEEKYSPHSWKSMAAPLNKYMKFLVEERHILDSDSFVLIPKFTMEMQKSGKIKQKRKRDTYSLEELISIKHKIDFHYIDNPMMKLRAYAMYFGICT